MVAEQGLCDNFIYNVTQDKNGYLWLGTGEGICRFDGFNFVQDFPGRYISPGPRHQQLPRPRRPDLVWV